MNVDVQRTADMYLAGTPFDLLACIDVLRLDVCRRLEQSHRGAMGQFLTPAPVARLMASMLDHNRTNVVLLDAGAGIGSLFAACVADICQREVKPDTLHVTAYEIDPLLLTYLDDTINACRQACRRVGITFTAEVRPVDFIKDAAEMLAAGLFASPHCLPDFTAAILNPPYRKINAQSDARKYLRQLGIETSNLYTGFLATATQLLTPDAELVAITPRSFCNGTYFRGFRETFLLEMVLRRIHLFDSREEAFRDDAVLQETIIVHAAKTIVPPERVVVTSSASAEDDFFLSQELRYSEVVDPNDPERFIRVVSDGVGQQVVERMDRFQATLSELGLTVSTGRVVDFRAREYLREQPNIGDAPLLYPVNLEDGTVVWPKATRKPQALAVDRETAFLLVPNEHYVLVKRFTSKEQARRVVASVFEGNVLPGTTVGFENHLNYFHQGGRGIDLTLARGLSIYLNCTLVDEYFRQFNGHTQVNATDLRSLKYPTLAILYRLGEQVSTPYPPQKQIDQIIEQELSAMTDTADGDPIMTKKRVTEAQEVLSDLGLQRAQINERSALTLLALLDLKPAAPWSDADNTLRGITPMMEFIDREYGKKYAPNSRETVRRQTVHQFLDAGLIIANPDAPYRPINSGKTVYQIETSALELFRTYGTTQWEQNLKTYGRAGGGGGGARFPRARTADADVALTGLRHADVLHGPTRNERTEGHGTVYRREGS